MEKECLPNNYECEQCKSGVGNTNWLEEKIHARKTNLEETVQKLKKEHNDVLMEIERIEEDKSKIGPRQRQLKESCKKNPAYGRHRISRPMWIVGPIQFWRVCVIYLEKRRKKTGLLTRPRVHAYTRPRVHMTDPRWGDGCSAPTPRF